MQPRLDGVWFPSTDDASQYYWCLQISALMEIHLMNINVGDLVAVKFSRSISSISLQRGKVTKVGKRYITVQIGNATIRYGTISLSEIGKSRFPSSITLMTSALNEEILFLTKKYKLVKAVRTSLDESDIDSFSIEKLERLQAVLNE